MLFKNGLGEVQSKIENPSIRFLLMFIAVVPGSLLLFATGIREFSVLQQPSLTWSFLAIALLLSVSISLGRWMFGHTVNSLSITAALPLLSQRRK